MASLVQTWLIRLAILAVVLAGAFGIWIALTWVSPEKVRDSVEAHLRAKFQDRVQVELGSAQVRLFGGLSVTELKLTRIGEEKPFLHVPSAIIYHNKEALSRGVLEFRKIELDRATLRIERREDGTWSFDDFVSKDEKALEGLPTLVLRHSTVILTDLRADAPPPVALSHLNFTLINDPLPILKFELSGSIVAAHVLQDDGTVPDQVLQLALNASGRYHRTAKHLTMHVESGELDIGPDLAPALEKLHPKVAEYCSRFCGKVSVKADISTSPEPGGLPKYDVRVELKSGRFEDPMLPWPLDRLTGTLRLNDGKITVEKMTGKLGHADAELTLESKPDLLCPHAQTRCTLIPGIGGVGPRWPPIVLAHQFLSTVAPAPLAATCDEPDALQSIEERLERFELKILSLSLDDELFGRLTPGAKKIRTMFEPVGLVDVAVRFRRPSAGTWRREVDVIPKGMHLQYELFRYPISDVYGSLKKVNTSEGLDEFQTDLNAMLAGKRITLTGRVAGESPDPLIDLTIAGKDIPIDAKFIAALPSDFAESLRKLQTTARGDFHITIKRESGVNRFENIFKIDVYAGTFCYEPFPYTLKQVRGNLQFKVSASDPERPLRGGKGEMPPPDATKIEIRNVEAVHDGGRFWLSGESNPIPNTRHRKLTMQIQGENCPLDGDLRAAFQSAKLERVMTSLALRGELTFGADVEIVERIAPPKTTQQEPKGDQIQPATAMLPIEPPFDPGQDLRISFNFRGPSITPEFFKYDLHNLSGFLRYQHGIVEILDLSARHGQSLVKVEAGEMRIGADKSAWIHLGNIKVNPLLIDSHMLKAFPVEARSGLEKLNLRGPVDLVVKDLIVSVPSTDSNQFEANATTSELVQTSHAGERWRAASPTRSDQSLSRIIPLDLLKLPNKAERKQPPSKPLILTASGLLPFSFPWSRPRTPPIVSEAMPVLPTALGQPVIYWNATLKMAGAALEAGLPVDDLYGSVSCEGRYEGTHIGAIMGTVWFEKATLAKQPFSQVKVSYRTKAQQPDPQKPDGYLPAIAEFRDLSASVFGGTIGGEARAILSNQPRFRLWLTATDVKLQDVAKFNKLGSGEVSGLAQGHVMLENPPDPKTGINTLIGTGQLDVPEGRLYNLPVLLEMVKVLKGQTPDGVAFEEAHLNFELKGDLVTVPQVDLLGSAVSLGGSGYYDLKTEDVKFDFYTIWSQTLRRWLMTPFGEVTGLMSGGLFKIELSRVDGKLTPKAHMLPAVTDPLRAVAERWRTRFGREVQANPTVRGSSR